ncbi:MAG: hypothetical protein LBG95_04910, partial [Treponema sp.]|nr:hypothetical protein [Treponema sp.]
MSQKTALTAQNPILGQAFDKSSKLPTAVLSTTGINGYFATDGITAKGRSRTEQATGDRRQATGNY